MSDLHKIRERLRQNRTAQRESIANIGAGTGGKPTPTAGTFPVGSTVFDLETGEEVIVAGYTTENIIVPTSRQREG